MFQKIAHEHSVEVVLRQVGLQGIRNHLLHIRCSVYLQKRSVHIHSPLLFAGNVVDELAHTCRWVKHDLRATQLLVHEVREFRPHHLTFGTVDTLESISVNAVQVHQCGRAIISEKIRSSVSRIP